MKKLSAFKNLIKLFQVLFTFSGIILASIVIGIGGLLIYKVNLTDNIVPDVSGPVARFIADVNFETRTVNLDATITKSPDSKAKIAIWRLGDGKIIKNTDNEINTNQVMSYTFKQAGTYQLSYSIIDENDLSDEAFCTINFVEEKNTEGVVIKNIGNLADYSDTDCGKSYQSYNSDGGIYAINKSRSDTRQALFLVGAGFGGLVFTVLIAGLMEILMIRRITVSSNKNETEITN